MSENCCDYGCSQGKNCPIRATYSAHPDVFPLHTRDGGEQVVDGLPVAMFITPLQWLGDLFLDVVWWTGTGTLIGIVAAALGFATGLYHIF